MPDFKELEDNHKRTPVTIDEPGTSGNGVLSLAGNETELHLSTSDPLGFKADENGWFDLRLKTGKGESVFLHNALLLQTSSRGANREDAEASIFPNFVALRANHLSDDGKLTKLIFTLKGLRDFFYYEAVEYQNLSKITPDIRKALKKLRTLEKTYPRDHEFFYPDTLWIAHRMPRVLRFSVGDRTYEVHLAVGQTMSFSNPSFNVYPIATITFKKPVTIDEAMGHAWDWRRFFSQLAMEQLPFEGISARANRRPRGYASLYLPNLHERPPIDHPYKFYPGLAPFNRWKERKLLAQSMKQWLERSSDRRIFRASLEDVIEDMQARSTPDHVLSLAAGIESLPELDAASPYSKKDVKTLVKGAAAAAKAAKIDIETERIQGLLGMLRKQNLSRRVKLLSDTVAPLLSADPAVIFNAVQRIRNARAHGGDGIEQLMPMVSATTHALAAMCAIWDQKTSGMPFEKLDRRLNPQNIASHGLNHLRQLERQ